MQRDRFVLLKRVAAALVATCFAASWLEALVPAGYDGVLPAVEASADTASGRGVRCAGRDCAGPGASLGEHEARLGIGTLLARAVRAAPAARVVDASDGPAGGAVRTWTRGVPHAGSPHQGGSMVGGYSAGAGHCGHGHSAAPPPAAMAAWDPLAAAPPPATPSPDLTSIALAPRQRPPIA